MTNKEILEKAIQKAIDGGWLTILCSSLVSWKVYDFKGVPRIALTIAGTTISEHPYQYIFDKNFAKALWDKPVNKFNQNVFNVYELNGRDIQEWEYKLAEMVIAEDPIKYLGENI